MPAVPYRQYLHNGRQRLLRIRPHIPFTAAGIGVLLLALSALQWFGYQRMDLVVFALTICAISILAFSLFVVTISGIALRRYLKRHLAATQAAIRVEAGYPNETGVDLPALPWLPLMTLEWHLIAPDPIETHSIADSDNGRLREEITPRLRCSSKEITRLFTLRDVLGLCRFSWRDTQPHTIQVLPRTGHLRQLPALRSLDAEDGIPNPSGAPQGDRMDIRRYAPGDSVKDIMWRVYARNRHLNVRLPEKSLFHADRTLAYLISGPDDEAAAGVARFALDHGALGSNWVFGADGSHDTARTITAALPIIAGSRTPGRNLSYGLDDFLEQQGPAACIVFAPATPGTWTQALHRTLARHPGQFSLVLATDGLRYEATQPWWQNLLVHRPPTEQGRHVNDLKTLMQSFRQAKLHLVMVDRQTGECFDQGLKRV